MNALDWAAKVVEENGRELAESFLSAARNGDWRAADVLMNRIYGKPDAALVAYVPPNPMIDVIRAMSLDEKFELLQRLHEGRVRRRENAASDRRSRSANRLTPLARR
jgi:hypothetical protein